MTHPSWLEPWPINGSPTAGHGINGVANRNQPAESASAHGPRPPGAHPGAQEAALVRQLRREVAQRLTEVNRRAGTGASTVAPDRQLVARLIADALDAFTNRALAAGSPPLRPEVESRVGRAVTDALLGMGGLQQLLDDPDVEDVVANGCDNVWVRYAGVGFTPAAPIADSDDDLVDLVRMLAARSGMDERRFDRAHPILDLQLPDGSRLNAVMAVCPRPSLSIRRHGMTQVTLADLQAKGTIDSRLAAFVSAAVRARLNILIAGPTGVGKTTALRAFASAIDPLERLVTIEDSFELGLHTNVAAHPNVAPLQAREANVEGEGAIGMSALFKAGLRMAPGRVLVGEARGPEVLVMLNAMSQGNDGSLGTIHASTSAGVLEKLAVYAAQAPEQLSSETIKRLIAEALHLVVQLRFTADGLRVVTSVREIAGYDGDQVASNEIFRPGPDGGRAQPGAPISTAALARLEAHGFDRRWLQRPADWRYPGAHDGPIS